MRKKTRTILPPHGKAGRVSDHEKVREAIEAVFNLASEITTAVNNLTGDAYVVRNLARRAGQVGRTVAALRSAPVEPESRDERVRYAMAHAYSDATTPGFFKVPTVGETNEPPTPVGKGEGDDERGRILQRGEHGGPLVQIVAEYEDGTKRNVDAAVRSLFDVLQEARAVHMDAERDVQRTATMLSQLRAERDALAEKLSDATKLAEDAILRLPAADRNIEWLRMRLARLDTKQESS
jgi:hypothetical protein